jgi:hypothetical protein
MDWWLSPKIGNLHQFTVHQLYQFTLIYQSFDYGTMNEPPSLLTPPTLPPQLRERNLLDFPHAVARHHQGTWDKAGVDTTIGTCLMCFKISSKTHKNQLDGFILKWATPNSNGISSQFPYVSLSNWQILGFQICRHTDVDATVGCASSIARLRDPRI